MKAYLEHLWEQIWQSKERDNEIYNCLQQEIRRAIDIQLFVEYNYNENHPERTEEAYQYEKEYKNQVLELLSKIENWD